MSDRENMIREIRKYLGLLDDEDSLAALPEDLLAELYQAVRKAGRWIWGMSAHDQSAE